MEQNTFKNGMRRIFAAHGKIPPSETVLAVVWERLRDKPDPFMDWAAQKLADCEKLPGNLGLELERALLPQWRAETKGESDSRVYDLCPDCDRQLPGFFYVWSQNPDGTRHMAVQRCLCNSARGLDPLPRKSKAQAQREGRMVMPQDWSAGPAGFEAWMDRA